MGVSPILRMFGVTDTGNSVCAHIHGFMPYIYVPAPLNQFSPTHCLVLQDALDQAISSDGRSGKDSVLKTVLAVDPVQKCSMYGFHDNRLYPFLKITLALPRLVAPAKRLLERGIPVPGLGTPTFTVFESNIEYELRFMIDMDVVGCNWIECPPGKYCLRKPCMGAIGNTMPTSKTQIELDISYEDFISHVPEGEWQKIAPLRILSFDIECAGRKGISPEPEHDPVIQIASMVIQQGEKDPFVRNVFTLNSCYNIVGTDVKCFDNEEEMLQVCN